MKTTRLMAMLLIAAFALAACTPAQGGSSTDSAALPTPPPSALATSAPEPAGLRSIQIYNVEVQIGVGSPTPVDIVVSGVWPDLCAQLAETQQHMKSGKIEITLLASPADPNCPPDHLGVCRSASPSRSTRWAYLKARTPSSSTA